MAAQPSPDQAAKKVWVSLQLKALRRLGKGQTREEVDDLRSRWLACSVGYKSRFALAVGSFASINTEYDRLKAEATSKHALLPTLAYDETGELHYEDDDLWQRQSFAEYVAINISLLDAMRELLYCTKELHSALGNHESDQSPEHDRQYLSDTLGALQGAVAQHADVVANLTDRAPLHEQALHKRMEAKIDAERSLQSLGPEWVGGWDIGDGAFGKVSIWAKQDAQGTIVDRIVIKDTVLNEEHEDHAYVWDLKSEFWVRDPRMTSGKELPVEVVAMYNLKGLVGSETVVKIRNYRMDSPKKMHRLYLEFCASGTLWDSISGYLERRNADDPRNRGQPAWLPEAFLWHTFECLATAGLLMGNGGLEPRISAWDVIVHRDYKLANVFLGSSLPDRYQGYSTPKLGDFGFAVMLPPNDTRRPKEFTRCGTPFCRAPEQLWLSKDREDAQAPPMRLSSKTNTWGVGNLMWCLVELVEGDEENLLWEAPQDYAKDSKKTQSQIQPVFRERSRDVYDEKLLTLILRCVAYDPDERPSFQRILRLIRRHTESKASDDSVDDDLRCLPKSHPGFARDMTLPAEKLPLGTPLDRANPPSHFSVMPRPPRKARNPGPEVDSTENDDSDERGGSPGAELSTTASADLMSEATETRDAPVTADGSIVTPGVGLQPGHQGKSKVNEKGTAARGKRGPGPARQPSPVRRLPPRECVKDHQDRRQVPAAVVEDDDGTEDEDAVGASKKRTLKAPRKPQFRTGPKGRRKAPAPAAAKDEDEDGNDSDGHDTKGARNKWAKKRDAQDGAAAQEPRGRKRKPDSGEEDGPSKKKPAGAKKCK
ncbi:hypothetical protein LTR36_007270 [Oleoguttula mirabilis]|uniref:non-specific serine/threonine protein kinase n=1 Tax=Oleoguttula mirabilis TaxID=1507867 RepID=A0AAV9JA79_9PEZI|nr:hypothetical protein LTR36_007270 [Oleoguttula mirabilis]